MISVVIATLNDERTLGEVLSALVPAVVDGLLREVIVADGGSTDRTLDIADDAGVRIMRSSAGAAERLVEACRAVRSDWLLVLDVGAAPPWGWDKAVAGHLRAGMDTVWWGTKRLWRTEPKGILMSRRVFGAVGLDLRGARQLKI